MRKIKKPADYGVKECEECGKVFQRTAANSKYCCAECKKKAYDRLQQKYTDEIRSARRNSADHWNECRHCGRLFKSDKIVKLYCSTACQNEAKKKRDREKYLRRVLEMTQKKEAERGREMIRTEPKKRDDRVFTWAQVLQCMKANDCQYQRAVEILNKQKGD